ncbi:MAG: NfeD family protein [Candidatus Cyclobacteriaceae bacterium M2_1C_046]
MKQLLFSLILLLSFDLLAQEATSVLVLEIRSEIDPRTSRYLDLGLKRAREMDADIVIIDMDTYGGLVTDAKDMVENILDYEKPIWTFINKDAASAGALISIATDSIYMAPGANIGAATVVTGQGEAAPDKYQSYMRSTMRSTAEEKGRDPKIAEAMVDESIDLDTLAPAGQVLTLTTSEAIAVGYAEAKVSSIEEILERNNIDNYVIERYELGTTEKVIAFFINPFISGILILVIVGGLWFELQTPGVGFPILASVTALILYLVPYYIHGLAENWEIIAFVVGVILLMVELFVIPGFGVAGISGVILTVGSLVMIMLNNDAFDFSMVPFEQIFIALSTTLLALMGSMILLFTGGVRLASSNVFKRVALMDTQARTLGYTSKFSTEESMVGKTGTAYTVLRPSGKVMIEGMLYDAYTRGGYIDQGQSISVIDDSGNSLKVQEAE